MRTIKFRAVFKGDNDKWEEDRKMMFYQQEIDCDLKFVYRDFMYDFDIPFLDTNWILMQYTGFKDKNGKEIYEGDLCRADSGETTEVLFEQGCFFVRRIQVDNELALMIDNSLEVIGNIYENPELLDSK